MVYTNTAAPKTLYQIGLSRRQPQLWIASMARRKHMPDSLLLRITIARTGRNTN